MTSYKKTQLLRLDPPSLNTTTPLIQPNFFGSTVVVLTGFHCIYLFVYLEIYFFVYLIIHLFVYYLFIHLSFYTHLSIYIGQLKLPVEDLVDLARLILKNNYFEFDNKIYKQKLGTAIGTKFASCLQIFLCQNWRERC